MWQDDSEAKSIQKSWSDAQIYCEDLSLGGYTDYRLPTKVELETLIDFSKHNPAIDNAFKNISSSVYWSSTTNVGNSDYARYLHFGIGNTGIGSKSNSGCVRCVRGGQ